MAHLHGIYFRFLSRWWNLYRTLAFDLSCAWIEVDANLWCHLCAGLGASSSLFISRLSLTIFDKYLDCNLWIICQLIYTGFGDNFLSLTPTGPIKNNVKRFLWNLTLFPFKAWNLRNSDSAFVHSRDWLHKWSHLRDGLLWKSVPLLLLNACVYIQIFKVLFLW